MSRKDHHIDVDVVVRLERLELMVGQLRQEVGQIARAVVPDSSGMQPPLGPPSPRGGGGWLATPVLTKGDFSVTLGGLLVLVLAAFLLLAVAYRAHVAGEGEAIGGALGDLRGLVERREDEKAAPAPEPEEPNLER